MKLGFFSDPHLGISRLSHATVRSSMAFRQFVFKRTLEVIEALKHNGAKKIICGGDLFDTYTNDEAVIAQGWTVLMHCWKALAGNHDVVNRTDKIGSLQLLNKFSHHLFDEEDLPVVVSPDPSKPDYRVASPDSSSELVFAPHCLTQSIFEQSVEMACEFAEKGKGARNIYLVLHCNVGVPGEAYNVVDPNGTSLYFTEAMQERALSVYTRIFVGHEHPPRMLHNDRLIVMGNVFPVTFGELSDRFVYVLDTATDTLQTIETLQVADMYQELRVEDVLDGLAPMQGAPFIEIKGRLEAKRHAELAKAIANLWKQVDENLTFFIKNSVEVIKAGAAKVEEVEFIPRTLPEVIGDSIANTPHKPAYDEAVTALAAKE